MAKVSQGRCLLREDTVRDVSVAAFCMAAAGGAPGEELPERSPRRDNSPAMIPSGHGANDCSPTRPRTYRKRPLGKGPIRASMAVSLEARVPILDHRVVEILMASAAQVQVRDGRGKWILRQILYKHVPPALVDREKNGILSPTRKVACWPLKNWAGDLLVSNETDVILRGTVVRRDGPLYSGRFDQRSRIVGTRDVPIVASALARVRS